MAYERTQWGASIHRFEHARATDNPRINSRLDNKPLLINSRDFAQTSGTSIGFQTKPNQTATGASVTGAEFSPRYTDAGGGSLICIKADPVLKAATSARTVDAVRGVEINIDFPDSGSAYTITNDTSAIRVFGDFGSGHTFTGKKSVVVVASPNTAQWDYLLDVGSGNTALVAAKTAAAVTHVIPIRFGSTNYWIMVSDAA